MENNQQNVSEKVTTQDESQTIDELNQLENDKQESEQEFKFVIIGGNEPLVNESFLKSLDGLGIPISVFELTTPEMKFIINSRAQVKAEEASVDYLQNEENKKRMNEWVILLINNHMNSLPRTPENIERIKSILEGKEELIFNKKNLKQASKLSWTQFEELFATLELFGLLNYNSENLKEFSLIIDNSSLIKNKMNELKQFLRLASGKISSIVSQKDISKADIKKLNGYKTKLSSIIESL